MKIVIAGGNVEAEFIIKMFSGKGDDLIVINPSKEMAEIILKRCKVPVYVGSPWRKFALDEANAYDADAFISLLRFVTNRSNISKVFSCRTSNCYFILFLDIVRSPHYVIDFC